MLIIKKLLFSIPFLLTFYFFSFGLSFFLKDIYSVFNLSVSILLQLIWLTLALLFSSFFFVVFSALTNNWKVVLPIAIVASISPIIFVSLPLSLLLSAGFLGSLLLELVIFSQKLKTYITFQANSLFDPSIKTLSSFLILVSSLAFYLSANLQVQTKGFQIPDSILDATLKIAAPPTKDGQGVSIAEVPSITPEQLQFLKNNPDLVKQAGYDPNIINQAPVNPASSSAKTTVSPSNDLTKKLIQEQVQNFIKPYQGAIPSLLAIIFFVTLHSFLGFLSILLPILTGGLFWILEKSGFIRFEIEMREVKKMVV